MNDLFVLLLALEYDFVNVLQVLNLVEHDPEVPIDGLLQGIEHFDLYVLDALFAAKGQLMTGFLAPDNLKHKVYLHATK
jgi:hypothetical protein